MAKAVGSILVGNWVILLLSVLLFLLGQPLLLPFPWSSLGQGAAPCLTTGLPSQGDPRGEGPGGQEPSDGGSSTWTGSLQAVQVLKKNQTTEPDLTDGNHTAGERQEPAWAHPSNAWLAPSLLQ